MTCRPICLYNDWFMLFLHVFVVCLLLMVILMHVCNFASVEVFNKALPCLNMHKFDNSLRV